jgi:hypothetical protein
MAEKNKLVRLFGLQLLRNKPGFLHRSLSHVK